MIKLWVRCLVVALICGSLTGPLFSVGAQVSLSADQSETSPARLAIEENLPAIPTGFQIVSISEVGLVLDIRAPSFDMETGQIDGGTCTKLKADGYAPSGEAGEPGLLSAGVMFGIPLDTNPTIRVLSTETIDLPGRIHLCPLATPIIARESGGPGEYLGAEMTENRPAYSQEVFLPTEPIQLVMGGMLRSQRVAKLLFTPFQYNAARNELRLTRHIRLEVQLGNNENVSGSSSPVDEGAFEELLGKILINYDQARSWRARPVLEAAAPASPSDPRDEADYKIQVNQDGLYQVTYAALQSAGVPVSSIDPRTFRLTNHGMEIPIYVSGESDGQFNAGDYILFYGQKASTKYTDTNIYRLSWGAGNGLRMVNVSGAVTGSATPPPNFRSTLKLEENHEYWINAPSGLQNDHWYWFFLNATSAPASKDFTFQLQNLASDSLTASVRGLLKGTSAIPQHHTQVLINGHLINDQTWPSTGEHAFAVDIPQSYLVPGTNTITVRCPRDGGITIDRVLVNWFELDVYHTYVAENNQLVFGGDQPGLWEFQVGGYSNDAISVFDITDPDSPAQIVGGNVVQNGSFYQVSFEQDVSGGRSYLALTPSRWLTPIAIIQNVPSTLMSPANGADYIIISHHDFLDAIQPLATYRAGQGLRVKVVDVQDVYDEFNGGVFSPQAIHSFLSYAYSNWIAPVPSYILLVGDGHYDFKNIYGNSGPNYVPPYLGEFDPWIGETASDNRYVTVSGSDSLPDMYIGRIPANSAAETTAMVNKIMAYEQAPLQGDWNTRLTFVADNADSGGNFPVLSDAIADHYLRPEFIVEKIYYGITHSTAEGVTAALLAAINQGRLVVHYTGHGSTQYWAAEKYLQVSNVASLSNSGKYPFFVPMTCAEGYFIFPKATGFNYPSLAESLVRASDKGAIASFSPTGFGLSNGHDIMAQGLYHAIFSDGTLQFGPATTFAKYYLNVNSSGFLDLLDTFMLFGDPASRLKTNPTGVLLTSFTGQSMPGMILLDWETANEVGLVGFNVYRSITVDGVKQKLNSSLISANYHGQMRGDVYQYIDLVGPGEHYFYWLELVQIGGSDLADPIEVTSGYWIHIPMLFND